MFVDSSLAGLIGGSLIAVICIIWGVVLCAGRGAMSIAGYNTMSDNDKAKWDEKRLCRSTGKLMIGTGIWLFAITLLSYFELFEPVLALIPIFLIVIIAWIVYVNKSPKFKQKQ